MRTGGSGSLPQARGLLLTGLMLALSMAGCLQQEGDGDPDVESLSSLSIYEYRYQGDSLMHPDHPYGWMLRVTNQREDPVSFTVQAHDNDTDWGPVETGGWKKENGTTVQRLDPDRSLLFLFQRPGVGFVSSLEYSVSVVTGNDSPGRVLEKSTYNRTLERPLRDEAVDANHHVTTATVGVWVNGTSFYTNIRGLNEDPAFPAGYDRDDFGGTDLRVYVYDEDSSEQPPGSRDRCFFVTIPGYNDLLKSQTEGTSNVRFLAPQEAYTRDGAEDHDLYGDALVFMNTIVAHVGEVTPLQETPQPTGDCFDPENTAPLPEGPV